MYDHDFQHYRNIDTRKRKILLLRAQKLLPTINTNIVSLLLSFSFFTKLWTFEIMEPRTSATLCGLLPKSEKGILYIVFYQNACFSMKQACRILSCFLHPWVFYSSSGLKFEQRSYIQTCNINKMAECDPTLLFALCFFSVSNN